MSLGHAVAACFVCVALHCAMVDCVDYLTLIHARSLEKDVELGWDRVK